MRAEACSSGSERIDDLVRQSPERAYDVDFFESFAAEVGWRIR